MNEQIRKIAIEADAWCDKYYFGDKFYDIEWEKKFAELIVRECISKIENEAEQYAQPVWAVELVNDLKETFGIKK